MYGNGRMFVFGGYKNENNEMAEYPWCWKGENSMKEGTEESRGERGGEEMGERGGGRRGGEREVVGGGRLICLLFLLFLSFLLFL